MARTGALRLNCAATPLASGQHTLLPFLQTVRQRSENKVPAELRRIGAKQTLPLLTKPSGVQMLNLNETSLKSGSSVRSNLLAVAPVRRGNLLKSCYSVHKKPRGDTVLALAPTEARDRSGLR